MTPRMKIKLLLAENCVTIKQLSELMTQKTQKLYTPKSLGHKLRRESLSIKELFEIMEILGYNVDFSKIQIN
ncbi:hypothetical protein IJ541_10035 [bacterium]|nr:hypothetical protein [bacterium]